jgi:hypothetical protein
LEHHLSPALDSLSAWIVREKGTPSMNCYKAQSGSFDQIGHAHKKELASKDVVATDDIFY